MTGVRIMNGLTTLCLLLAFAAATGTLLVWAAQRPIFEFRRIDVRGDLQHVSALSVRSAIAGHLKGGYFTMRLDDTRSVMESVPWVAAASVRRVWPNRLLVTLAEHRALGLWDDGRILSDKGELFVANADEAEMAGPLPSFNGPAPFAHDAARHFGEFSNALAPLSLTLDELDVSDRASWSLSASSNSVKELKIELGRDDPAAPLKQRLDALVAAYPMVVARVGGPPPRLDARYPNGFAAAIPAKSSSH